MAFSSRLINTGGGGELPPMPEGIPIDFSYVGFGTLPNAATKTLNFGWDGQSIYEKVGTDTNQYKMGTPYDISSLSSTVHSNAGNGDYRSYNQNFSGTQAMRMLGYPISWGNAPSPFDATAAGTATGKNGPYTGAVVLSGFVTEDNYSVGSANNAWYSPYTQNGTQYLVKYTMATADSFSTINSGQTYNFTFAAGYPNTICHATAFCNDYNHLIFWDTRGGTDSIQIRSLQGRNNPYSTAAVSTIAIPTSDSTIRGIQANIRIFYQAGYLYAVREGETRIHQFKAIF